MYTKVFRSIYDGTLADNWRAMVTFQQLLILADAQGVVDMTVGAISRTTGIPVEILEEGIAVLEAPDAMSRTPDMEGRRIARLDEHRPWGWFLVNFNKYKLMRSREEKKEADRNRIAEKRDKERQEAAECDMSQSVADVAHTYTDLNLQEQKLTTDVVVNAVGADEQKVKARTDRLAQVTRDAVEAFNATMTKAGGGLLPAVTLPDSDTRRKQVKRSVRIAALACERIFGNSAVTPQFWADYFAEAARVPFLNGTGPYSKGHEGWRPSFEYLTRPDVIEGVLDSALSGAA